MTWRPEIQLPSSEDSKIALQARLRLSPSKLTIYIQHNSHIHTRTVSAKSKGEVDFINAPPH